MAKYLPYALGLIVLGALVFFTGQAIRRIGAGNDSGKDVGRTSPEQREITQPLKQVLDLPPNVSIDGPPTDYGFRPEGGIGLRLAVSLSKNLPVLTVTKPK